MLNKNIFESSRTYTPGIQIRCEHYDTPMSRMVNVSSPGSHRRIDVVALVYVFEHCISSSKGKASGVTHHASVPR